jgi:general secretion pathway protein H
MTKGGFTLLEVLLAVALIGLLATTLIGVSAHLLNDRPTSPDDVFWQATQEARRAALKSGQEVTLEFDGKSKAFVLSGGSARSFPIPSAPDDLAVDFLANQSGASSALIGGTLVETQTISEVAFYPDGTCVPFRVQFRAKGGIHKLEIDPWTGARVLAPLDATGSPVSSP